MESGVAAVILFGCLLGFGFAMRALAAETLKLSGLLPDAVAAGGILFLPGMYMYFSPLYDFATVLLFAAGLLFIWRQQWWSYFAVFLLATLNKETSILLTLVWFVWNWRAVRLPLRDRSIRLALQLGAWLLIRGGLAYLFRNNPGTALEWHLERNFAHLINPASYLLFRPSARFIPRGLNIVYLALLAWIVVRFRRVPKFVRIGLLPLLPLVVAAFCFGYIDELRDYYEVYPALMLALTASLISPGRIPSAAAERLASCCALGNLFL